MSLRWCAVLVSAVLLSSCGSTRGAYSNAAAPTRNIQKGVELFAVAVDLEQATLENDTAEKEDILLTREAAFLAVLDADLYHGAAHNNLGVVYMELGRMYEAANEFEWARKLLPGHPDPRVNLAALLDGVGRSSDAENEALAALTIHPGYVPALQTLALIQVRDQHVDKKTLEYLKEVALRGESEQWRTWAQQWQARLVHKVDKRFRSTTQFDNAG